MSLGEVISQREIDVRLDEGDLIEDVIVVASVMKEDGSRSLVVAGEERGNWIKEFGMLSTAARMVQE